MDLFAELDAGTDQCPRCGDECDCPINEAPEVVQLRAQVCALQAADAARLKLVMLLERQATVLHSRIATAAAQVSRVQAVLDQPCVCQAPATLGHDADCPKVRVRTSVLRGALSLPAGTP